MSPSPDTLHLRTDELLPVWLQKQSVMASDSGSKLEDLSLWDFAEVVSRLALAHF